jgi:hypothetical protein
MPAIQAMRSDALAMRSKEEVQEKIPSFYNSVNQALGQSIIAGQDAAEQLLEQRFAAANQLAAQIRQKVDGQGAISELTAGAGLKMISSALSITLAILSKTTTQELIELASALVNFSFELTTLKLQWEAAAATYAQWTVQAGFTGHGTSPLFTSVNNNAMGGRGALRYRDALTPRFTDRNIYTSTALGARSYETWYSWGSVGSISRVGQYT